MTAKLFDNFGISYKSIDADDSLDGFGILVIGREAITAAEVAKQATKKCEYLVEYAHKSVAHLLQQKAIPQLLRRNPQDAKYRFRERCMRLLYHACQ